jgi:hypothetical protein
MLLQANLQSFHPSILEIFGGKIGSGQNLRRDFFVRQKANHIWTRGCPTTLATEKHCSTTFFLF